MRRKQRAVFPLAAAVLLPQHESPPMHYHVQWGRLSAQEMGVGAPRRSTHFVLWCMSL